MDADAVFEEKQRFLLATEKRLRRRLNAAERHLLEQVFTRIIEGMSPGDGGSMRTPSNLSLIDRLTTVYQEFVKADLLDIVRDYARSTMKLIEFHERYFRIEVPGDPPLEKALEQGRKYIRARLGINPDGSLKAGGYLKAVIDDPYMRDLVRRETWKAIEGGKDLQGIKSEVRKAVLGEGEDPDGVLTKRWAQQTFDTLQESDADIHTQVAVALGLQGGEYAGGIIETTRLWCCERDGMWFTLDEMEAMGKASDWDGKKSDNVQLHRGGHGCRHQWRMVSNARFLRRRPDMMMGKDGKIVPRPGTTPPALNQGCKDRLAKKPIRRSAKAKRKARVKKK